MRIDDLTTSILAWAAIIAAVFGVVWLVRRRNAGGPPEPEVTNSEPEAKDHQEAPSSAPQRYREYSEVPEKMAFSTPPSSQPDPSSQLEDPELESWKKSKHWFVVTQTTSGERRICDKEHFVTTLRTSILDGVLKAKSPIHVYCQAPDSKWSKSSSPLAQFAYGHFKLRVLYAPFWSYTLAGLKWGALIGIGLKLLHTAILLAFVSPALAFLLLLAIGACFIPHKFIPYAGVIVAIALAKIAEWNFYIIAAVAALVGALLGCLPGMAVGAAMGPIGLYPAPRMLRLSPTVFC